MDEAFKFYTRLNLTELLGIKAGNLVELLEGIETVPGSAIYYHTHRYLQQHHFLSPEPPNDFAYWVANILQEEKLGEQLASVDVVQFNKIQDLRDAFIAVIGKYLQENKSKREAPDGAEFHFMKAISFVIPTRYAANNLEEFVEALKRISIHSIYFHIFESRLRLGRDSNDFSNWLENKLGETELAKKISKLDPYTYTLESLREKVIFYIKERINEKTK